MYKLVNGVRTKLSQIEIDEMQAEWDNNAIIVAKEHRNRVIYLQLEELDLKSIRSLRAKDEVKLAELEARAVLLRSQLIV